jgi:hypothetical protein
MSPRSCGGKIKNTVKKYTKKCKNIKGKMSFPFALRAH